MLGYRSQRRTQEPRSQRPHGEKKRRAGLRVSTHISYCSAGSPICFYAASLYLEVHLKQVFSGVLCPRNAKSLKSSSHR
jgi:hypothetical protein